MRNTMLALVIASLPITVQADSINGIALNGSIGGNHAGSHHELTLNGYACKALNSNYGNFPNGKSTGCNYVISGGMDKFGAANFTINAEPGCTMTCVGSDGSSYSNAPSASASPSAGLGTGNSVYQLTTAFRGDSVVLDIFSDTDKVNQTQLRPCGNYTGQMWRFRKEGEWLRLTTEFRGQDYCLDIYSDTDRVNQPQLRPCGNYSGQLWRVQPDGEYSRLTTMYRGEGMCLDVYSDSSRINEGELRPCGNYSGQLWKITRR